MENQKTKRILVVEDDPSMLEVLVNELLSEGFEVIETEDGEDGLWTALLERPDLILLDLIMPKKNGMTMLSQLRKDEWGKKVPVVILTNVNDINKVAEAMKNGVYDFLVKSNSSLQEVIKIIRKRLFLPA